MPKINVNLNHLQCIKLKAWFASEKMTSNVWWYMHVTSDLSRISCDLDRRRSQKLELGGGADCEAQRVEDQGREQSGVLLWPLPTSERVCRSAESFPSGAVNIFLGIESQKCIKRV